MSLSTYHAHYKCISTSVSTDHKFIAGFHFYIFTWVMNEFIIHLYLKWYLLVLHRLISTIICLLHWLVFITLVIPLKLFITLVIPLELFITLVIPLQLFITLVIPLKLFITLVIPLQLFITLFGYSTEIIMRGGTEMF